jgi:hypothetical protein
VEGNGAALTGRAHNAKRERERVGAREGSGTDRSGAPGRDRGGGEDARGRAGPLGLKGRERRVAGLFSVFLLF